MVLFTDIYEIMVGKITDSSISTKLPNELWDYSQLYSYLIEAIIVDYRQIGKLTIIKAKQKEYNISFEIGTDLYELVDFIEHSEYSLIIENQEISKEYYTIDKQKDEFENEKFYLHILDETPFDPTKTIELNMSFCGAIEEDIEKYDQILLAKNMLNHWIEPYINDENYLLKVGCKTRDFSESSHANLLKELMNLKESFMDDANASLIGKDLDPETFQTIVGELS